MSNTFGHFILYSWPFITVVIFRIFPVSKAIAWTIVLGYLFLPEQTGLDLPILPAFDKTSIPAFSAALMCWFAMRRSKESPKSEHSTTNDIRTFQVLMVLFFTSPLITVLSNADPVVISQSTHIPGMRLYDGLALVNIFLVTILPFLLGRQFLKSEDDHAALLKVLALGGVAYILPILIEVRMSPQLNVWIYGFFAHSFDQHIRGDGFRPIVFLYHGLNVAMFICMATISAASVWRLRSETAEKVKWLWVTISLLIVLYMVRSLGAFLIALTILSLILLLSLRGRMRFAAASAIVVLAYPLLRAVDVVPIDWVVETAELINPERALSFLFRVQNEDQLLARAMLKPWAGWGGWGRAEIYNEAGRSISVADGTWVIVMGSQGLFGYLGTFGLLTLPSILLWLRREKLHVGHASSLLCLVLSANLLDLLPNSALTPVTWLIAGAIMGRLHMQELRRSV